MQSLNRGLSWSQYIFPKVRTTKSQVLTIHRATWPNQSQEAWLYIWVTSYLHLLLPIIHQCCTMLCDKTCECMSQSHSNDNLKRNSFAGWKAQQRDSPKRKEQFYLTYKLDWKIAMTMLGLNLQRMKSSEAALRWLWAHNQRWISYWKPCIRLDIPYLTDP